MQNVQCFHLTGTNEFFFVHLISKFEQAGGSTSFLNCKHICYCREPSTNKHPGACLTLLGTAALCTWRNPHYKTTIPHVWFERVLKYQPFLSQTQLEQVPQLDR